MTRPIVVVGGSAGGSDALRTLLERLPGDFPASVFVVLHMARGVTGEPLLRSLQKAGPLRCELAEDGARFRRERLYLAPPDRHLLLHRGTTRLSSGAPENRFRPAVDPLFRSAAVAYGHQVVGVVLSGYLDDGTAGLSAIHRSGGVCVVQDPTDAAYPYMPLNAMRGAHVDHTVRLGAMGELLLDLVQAPAGPRTKPPEDVVTEAKLTEENTPEPGALDSIGRRSKQACPQCGGVMWEMQHDRRPRFRCHTGHAFSALTLMDLGDDKIEETLWTALRMFEERRQLLERLKRGGALGPDRYVRGRLAETEAHIRRLREILEEDRPLPASAHRRATQ